MNRQFHDMRVYVACSLTCAPKHFISGIEAFKTDLRNICEVLCFLGTGTGAKPEEVFHYDIDVCVGTADLVVAFCDLPSLGAGFEIAAQVEARQKPCLAVAHINSKVSDLIVGCSRPHFEFRRYHSILDVLGIVESALQRIVDKKNGQTLMFPDIHKRTRIETIPVGIPCLSTTSDIDTFLLFPDQVVAVA